MKVYLLTCFTIINPSDFYHISSILYFDPLILSLTVLCKDNAVKAKSKPTHTQCSVTLLKI